MKFKKEERKLLEYYLETTKNKDELLELQVCSDGDVELCIGIVCLCNFNNRAIKGFEFEDLKRDETHSVKELLDEKV